MTSDTEQLVHSVVNKSGEVFRVSAAGVKAAGETLPKGMLDGVVAGPDGDLFVSSWDAKAVYRKSTGGKFEPLIEKLSSPADMGFDTKRKRLLIPVLNEHALVIQQL